jgi:hypothetical protein
MEMISSLGTAPFGAAKNRPKPGRLGAPSSFGNITPGIEICWKIVPSTSTSSMLIWSSLRETSM